MAGAAAGGAAAPVRTAAPHDVVCQQPLIRLGALAVRAPRPCGSRGTGGLGVVLEDSAQKVVEPLACAALAHSTCWTLAGVRTGASTGFGELTRRRQEFRNVLFSLRVSGYDARRRRPLLVCDDAMPRRRRAQP